MTDVFILQISIQDGVDIQQEIIDVFDDGDKARLALQEKWDSDRTNYDISTVLRFYESNPTDFSYSYDPISIYIANYPASYIYQLWIERKTAK